MFQVITWQKLSRQLMIGGGWPPHWERRIGVDVCVTSLALNVRAGVVWQRYVCSWKHFTVFTHSSIRCFSLVTACVIDTSSTCETIGEDRRLLYVVVSFSGNSSHGSCSSVVNTCDLWLFVRVNGSRRTTRTTLPQLKLSEHVFQISNCLREMLMNQCAFELQLTIPIFQVRCLLMFGRPLMHDCFLFCF